MANTTVPEGAWDTHIHVFDPSNFPYHIPRSYTPKPAQLSEYPTDITGCKNIVIVHASIQGPSPAALLDTLDSQRRREGYTLRGLATVDINATTDGELDALHAAGVRGVRLHEMAWGHGNQSGGGDIIRKVEGLAERLARLGWVVDIFCPLSAWAAMAEMIRAMDPRVKMVADHFGGCFPGEEKSEEFGKFLELVREGRLFVKLSGFERLYHGRLGGVESMEGIARAIVEAGPERIVFGSDWPHTQLGAARKGKTDQERLEDVEGFREVDDAGHIRKLREWISDEETWYKFWVINPQRIFE